MKIRAHHLLCMQGFQGYGYSEEFSENMAEIIKKLDSHPDQRIEITMECDVICSCCPYDINGTCNKDPESHEKIKSMDIKILKKLELSCGSIFEAEKIFSLTNKKLNPTDVQEICGNCSWREKCIWFISKSK